MTSAKAPQKTARPEDRTEDTSRTSTRVKHLAHTPEQKRELLDEVGHTPLEGPYQAAIGDPVSNWAGRDNIVADGPGTVADFIVPDSDSSDDDKE